MKPERLERTSVDGSKLNLEALYQIAPSCFTEEKDEKTGAIKHVVNFKTLRQLLGDDAVDDGEEMYQFTWPGKQAARREAAAPITDTLRPVPEDSVDWDTTQNLYIEGDNLRVLKLLQKGYMGKVKMIYIDPPYNTGNDFVYHDDFTHTAEEEELAAGNIDEEGNRYRKNLDRNGRFHSDWCSMIYSRLLVARSLLTEDGVIFISIDDNEVRNLKNICDEVFGEGNRIGTFIWEKKKKPSFLNANIGIKTEYIICYAKERTNTGAFSVDVTTEGKKYPINNAGNSLSELTFKAGSVAFSMDDQEIIPQDMSEGNIKTTLLTQLTIRNGKNQNDFTLRGEWRYSQDKLDEIIANGEIITISKIPFRPNHVRTGGEIKKMHNLLSLTNYPVGANEDATAEQAGILGANYFDYAKPVSLIDFLIKAFTYSKKNAIILDFFSGSATTAHAVMQLNAEDGGNRKYICVQLPEETPEDSEARKAGYSTIPEIAKERIRRAGKKILETLENKTLEVRENTLDFEEEEALTSNVSSLKSNPLDIGFRVFRLADSNYENVEKSPNEYDQNMLDLFADNIKADRTDLDLLFGAMLSWGVQLSLPMQTEEVDGCKIYTVDGNGLVACFAENVTENVVKAMADKQPLRVLFRDSCFAEDKTKINIFELFKQQLDWDENEAMQNIRVI